MAAGRHFFSGVATGKLHMSTRVCKQPHGAHWLTQNKNASHFLFGKKRGLVVGGRQKRRNGIEYDQNTPCSGWRD